MRVLHVSPHLGGGVGRVVLNYLRAVIAETKDQYAVYCLDEVNPTARQLAAEMGLPVLGSLAAAPEVLDQAVAEADLVVVHWWNHPLLYDWLVNRPWPECRLMLWAHVSGHHAPQCIIPQVARLADIFALTTPHALKSPGISDLSDEERAEKVRLLFSCGGLDHVPRPEPRPHVGFRIGYVGTVDGQKMHPEYVEMSLAADIPEAVFVVAGGPGEGELRQKVRALGAESRFEILGPVPPNEVPAILAGLDVFGYPLHPRHYGALELALLEAQAAGLPPVVLAGGAEEFLVRDGVTGLVARDVSNYPRRLEELRRDPELRARLAQAAPADVRDRFSLARTVEAFSALYDELMARPKRPRRFPGRSASSLSAAELCLLALGAEAGGLQMAAEGLTPEPPLSPTFFSPTRGSPFHYLHFFPQDPWLQKCCALLSGKFSGHRNKTLKETP